MLLISFQFCWLLFIYSISEVLKRPLFHKECIFATYSIFVVFSALLLLECFSEWSDTETSQTHLQCTVGQLDVTCKWSPVWPGMSYHPVCVLVTLVCPQRTGLAAHMGLKCPVHAQSAQCVPVASDSVFIQRMVFAFIVLARKFQVQLWHWIPT